MTQIPLFSSPFLLGFDQLERALDRVSKSSADGYPPYNIEQDGENSLRITLAVAGFSRDELSVVVEGTQLTVLGKQGDDPERVYLHRGIAARQFQRSFVLADGMDVIGAVVKDGLLHVDLLRPPIAERRRVIEIRDESSADMMKDTPVRQKGGRA
ncbi:MAG: Hsp20 family protein [Rhodospirillales bacterium]|nr:Hsp20 family protein [Rhodospirillales bacterium]